jgi:16S rRNA G966 N2-methylase RsmD
MALITSSSLFGSIDFNKIQNDKDFKEDSVREEIIVPILRELGYNRDNIVRSKSLKHPFLKVGSNKKKPITLIPDYSLKVAENYAWVLDAKSPSESVTDEGNIEQVYSYAAHPEIRSTYFALCNGLRFSLYRRESTNEPILEFSLSDIEYKWKDLKLFLSPDSFQLGKNFTYESINSTAKQNGFDYKTRPLIEELPVRKRAAKRHFGVHGYFTKQAWNIVSEYILNFSKPGDVVLDPFGGSGVTAIEALMNDRKAIHIDLNPMSDFIVRSLITPVSQAELSEALNKIQNLYQKGEPQTKDEIDEALIKYPYPTGFNLPKTSDVKVIEDLFTDKQMAQLAFLKFCINKEKNEVVRNSLMLAFSSTLNKINRTYHNSSYAGENAGNSGPMLYYRYRIAPKIVDLNVWYTYQKKFSSVMNAKKEMEPKINQHTIHNAQIIKGTATDLSFIPKESVDYIYTDPPYGKKIPYLDLSVMWNAWLNLVVTEKDYEQEAIEGGEYNKSKGEYNKLISDSIKEMYRVLKYDRWMSFVFAHKDPEFWHLIIETAEACGFEYAGAVPQKNGQTSFKKRQNPFTVLSGQLIINFRKVKNPKAILRAHLGMDILTIILQTMEGVIAKNNGATLEQINDELIIKGLELGFLHLLKKQYTDLTPLLMDNFDYNEKSEVFTIKEDNKFRTHVDVKLRIRYYLISYLRKMERENKLPTFDEITFTILPLLRNGTTPEKQTISRVLEDIGEHVGDEKWRLRKGGQQTLFD